MITSSGIGRPTIPRTRLKNRAMYPYTLMKFRTICSIRKPSSSLYIKRAPVPSAVDSCIRLPHKKESGQQIHFPSCPQDVSLYRRFQGRTGPDQHDQQQKADISEDRIQIGHNVLESDLTGEKGGSEDRDGD